MAYQPNGGGQSAATSKAEAIKRALLQFVQGSGEPQNDPFYGYARNDGSKTNAPVSVQQDPFYGYTRDSGVTSSNPFAEYFAGNLGGGPQSPDLAALNGPKTYDRGKTEGPMIGPVAPEIPEQVIDPNLEAINQLMNMAMQGGVDSGGSIDVAGIMKEAAGAAGAPFKAEIGATKRQNGQAKADTDYSSKEIRKMYRALGRSNARMAEKENAQSLNSAQAIRDQAANSAQSLTEQNDSRIQNSIDQAAALGSGDLAATLSADANQNTAESARQLADTAGLSANVVAERGDAGRQYFNASSQNAKLTGTNRAADLYGDLQDYLQGNRDKISSLRGQQTAAVANARSQAAGQAAQAQAASQQNAAAAQQQQLENMMALFGMKTDLQQQDFDNNLSSQQLQAQLMQQQAENAPTIPGIPEGLLEAMPEEQRSALIMQQYLNPQAGKALDGILNGDAASALAQGFAPNAQGGNSVLGGNPLNSQALLQQLGLTQSDPMQNMILSQIIAQLASGNNNMPYGAQR